MIINNHKAHIFNCQPEEKNYYAEIACCNKSQRSCLSTISSFPKILQEMIHNPILIDNHRDIQYTTSKYNYCSRMLSISVTAPLSLIIEFRKNFWYHKYLMNNLLSECFDVFRIIISLRLNLFDNSMF